MTREQLCGVLGTFAGAANKSTQIKPKWIHWIYTGKSQEYIGWSLKDFSVLYSALNVGLPGYLLFWSLNPLVLKEMNLCESLFSAPLMNFFIYIYIYLGLYIYFYLYSYIHIHIYTIYIHFYIYIYL